MTGDQIRQARKLLGWPSSRLAQRAKMHSAIVRRAESVDGEPPITVYQAALIRDALGRDRVHERRRARRKVDGDGGAQGREVITGQQIRAARELLGWTLAPRASLGHTLLRQFEAGDEPTVDVGHAVLGRFESQLAGQSTA
jgi:ribosome-binding protein aMBF1 (putative translation factor)